MSDVLTKYQRYQKYLKFINEYKNAINASTGSQVDSNANVECKNIATMNGEIFKKDYIYLNRLMMIEKITELYGEDLAVDYILELENHDGYKHDETSIFPYCVSITMYPFLFDGLKSIGGISDAPKHLKSFAGEFINLIFAIASQFAGAVSTPEFLTYMDYFVRKEYGDEYYSHANKVVDLSNRERTIDDIITDVFQQVVHSLNQPAAARNFQSVFWNIAYFDHPYFNGIFDGFVFPDGTLPQWDSVNWLQKRFMNWFNKERTKKPLTFPVETMNLLNDGKDYVDKEYKHFNAEMYAKGHSFFTYTSDTVDSLASCCRLKNAITDNTFSFTLGAGGVATGSKGVFTININRLVQNAVRNNQDISEAVREQTRKIHKYLNAYNEILKGYLESKMLPVFDAGFISMDNQYLTIGINVFVEGDEFLGIEISPNEEYYNYGEMILKPIYEENKKAKTKDVMFNTEFVPAENLGIKNAMWDKKDGYVVPRDCYNSYFYIVEDENSNLLDKFILHGDRLSNYLDGGSALHANLQEHYCILEENFEVFKRKTERSR
ncbi:anaerobic ribonucleoside-triphosphate reductase [Anaerosporobacter sp.]